MADNSKYKVEYEGVYNYHGRYDYVLNHYAIGLDVIQDIDKVVTNKWGWYFIGHDTQDYRSEDWYKDQHCVITFDDQEDLVQAILSVGERL